MTMSFDSADSPLPGIVQQESGVPYFDPSFFEGINPNDDSFHFDVNIEAAFLSFVNNSEPHFLNDEEPLALALSSFEPVRHGQEKSTGASTSVPLPNALQVFNPEGKVWPCYDDAGRLVPSQEEWQKCTNNRSRKALTSWYDRLNEYLEYRRGEGRYEDPQRLPRTNGKKGPLGNWVNKTRAEKKKFEAGKPSTFMYLERAALLDYIDFTGAKNKDTFDTRIRQLTEFHRIVGHAVVPVKPYHKEKEEEKGPEDLQITRAVEKRLNGRKVDVRDRKTLFDLLKDHNFCRWVTQMRVRFKHWQSETVDDDDGDSSKWQRRKRELAETEFSFSQQKRHCA